MNASRIRLISSLVRAFVGLALVFYGGGGWVSAEDLSAVVGSQTEAPLLGTELLNEELQFALETAHRRIEALEKQLEGKSRGGQAALVASLAAANREAEQYRIRYRDLLVRVESLGLATIRSDSALEDRMIKAVRERQHYLEQTQQSQEQIMRLSDAVMDYLKVSTSSTPEVRLKLEAEMRRADEVLGFAGLRRPVADDRRSLGEGHVVGYKADLRLAVIDIGARNGVRVGMPLNIVRKDRLVGTALVVDVRDSVSGALVQEYFREGDRVEVRDRVEPRTIPAANL